MEIENFSNEHVLFSFPFALQVNIIVIRGAKNKKKKKLLEFISYEILFF
jgi:hypothetical protein